MRIALIATVSALALGAGALLEIGISAYSERALYESPGVSPAEMMKTPGPLPVTTVENYY